MEYVSKICIEMIFNNIYIFLNIGKIIFFCFLIWRVVFENSNFITRLFSQNNQSQKNTIQRSHIHTDDVSFAQVSFDIMNYLFSLF